LSAGREGRGSQEQDEAQQETGESCEDSAHSRLQHVDLLGRSNLAKLSQI
jgi:hypothetical protein